MAFMMPVMKNNYDIYKDSRSRKSSEGSAGAPTLSSSVGAAPSGGRTRKVSECKSESFATSPSHTYRMQMQRCQSSRGFTRNSSRSSTAGPLSPTRSFSQTASTSPPKQAAPTNTTAAATNANGGGVGGGGSQNDISKFHLRLVEKLRKSFRKDSAANKRS